MFDKFEQTERGGIDMKCPKCGQEMARSKKDPEYMLCRNCKKKYKIKEGKNKKPIKKEITKGSNKTKNAIPKKQQKRGKKKFIFIFFILVILIVFGISQCSGGESENKSDETKNSSSEKANETEANSPDQIVLSYFPTAEVEYDSETKNLYITAKVDSDISANSAFNVNGGKLARCVGDIMQKFPDTNIYDVTIYSETFPNILTCVFNPEKLKSITDWENFTQSDIASVCDAYSDSKQ